jgi:aminomethyltransferase
MGYPLNGNDLSPDRTPLEAGLGFFVDLTKPDFIGKSVLADQKANGAPTKLVALAVTEKSPPIRAHYPVHIEGTAVGETSSGALSPSLGIGIAMAYVPTALARLGTPVEIEVRGKKYPAVIKKKPLYSRPA